MSRIYEIFERQEGHPLEDLPSEGEPDLKTYEKESFFELPRLLMDLSPELLEEFRCISRNLWILGSKELKSVMVCGIGDSEDSSTVALNLSVFMGRTEESAVLLVEANIHSPTLHRFHKGRKCDGFCELLEEHRPVELYAMPTTEPRLFVIRVGGSVRQEYARFPRAALEHVVGELESKFPFVLFDGPPVGTEDCLGLAGCVDGVVLVIRTGELAERVEQAKSKLDKAQAKILGVILSR